MSPDAIASRVDELLVRLFGRSALQVDGVYTAEADLAVIPALVERLIAQGYARIEIDGRQVTVRV